MLNAAQTAGLQRNVRRAVDKSVKNILWYLFVQYPREMRRERKGRG